MDRTFLWLSLSLAHPPPQRLLSFLCLSVSLSGWGVGVSFRRCFLARLVLHCSIITAHHRRHNGAWVFHERTNGNRIGIGIGLAWMGMGGSGLLSGTDSGQRRKRKKKHDINRRGFFRISSFSPGGRFSCALTLLHSHTHPPLMGRRTLGSWIPLLTHGLIHPWLGWYGWTGVLGREEEEDHHGRFLSGFLGSFGLPALLLDSPA